MTLGHAGEESTRPFQNRESLSQRGQSHSRATIALQNTRGPADCLWRIRSTDFSMLTRWLLDGNSRDFTIASAGGPKRQLGAGTALLCGVTGAVLYPGPGRFDWAAQACLGPGPHLRRAAVSDLEEPANGRHLISFQTQTRFSPAAGPA